MPSNKLTLSQLEHYLSKAAWILKGPIESQQAEVHFKAKLKGFLNYEG